MEGHRPTWAFVTAGVVAIVGLLVEELAGITDFDMWPWLVASGIPYSLGLADLVTATTRPGTRTLRMGRASAMIGVSVPRPMSW